MCRIPWPPPHTACAAALLQQPPPPHQLTGLRAASGPNALSKLSPAAAGIKPPPACRSHSTSGAGCVLTHRPERSPAPCCSPPGVWPAPPAAAGHAMVDGRPNPPLCQQPGHTPRSGGQGINAAHPGFCNVVTRADARHRMKLARLNGRPKPCHDTASQQVGGQERRQLRLLSILLAELDNHLTS